MIRSLIRLLRIMLREKPVKPKPIARYRVTLDLAKVRPDLAVADVPAYLMKIGFTPTTRANVWKTKEPRLSVLPHEAILQKEEL
jgi:hypothetical protein